MSDLYAGLREKAQAATQGEWSFEERPSHMTHIFSPLKKGAICYLSTRTGKWVEPSRPNAAYIAAANPKTVLALLDDNARLRAEVDRWISAYEIAHDQATENGAKANSLREDKAAIFDHLATLAAMPALRCKNTLGEAVRQYRQTQNLSHHTERKGP